MSETPNDEVEAPGWDAIDRWVGAKLGTALSGQVPHQYTSRAPYELDKPSPLPAITVWSTRQPAGWLYVSYGLSELFDKTADDPAISGFGFELTLRIPPAPDAKPDAPPPTWGLRLMQSLGRHVLTAQAGFDSGDAIDLGAPLVPPGGDGPSDCALTGLICLPDPLLGKINTVNGSLLFLRVVGVTRDEMAIFDGLELGSLVACMAELEPHAITDPGRASDVDHPERGKILRRYRLGIEL